MRRRAVSSTKLPNACPRGPSSAGRSRDSRRFMAPSLSTPSSRSWRFSEGGRLADLRCRCHPDDAPHKGRRLAWGKGRRPASGNLIFSSRPAVPGHLRVQEGRPREEARGKPHGTRPGNAGASNLRRCRISPFILRRRVWRAGAALVNDASCAAILHGSSNCTSFELLRTDRNKLVILSHRIPGHRIGIYNFVEARLAETASDGNRSGRSATLA
jgi:hypothetical protein